MLVKLIDTFIYGTVAILVLGSLFVAVEHAVFGSWSSDVLSIMNAEFARANSLQIISVYLVSSFFVFNP